MKGAPLVTWINGLDIRDRMVEIRADAADPEQPFKLWLEDVAVAWCVSPDTLGRAALDAGVKECRHKYDMVKHHAALHNPIF